MPVTTCPKCKSVLSRGSWEIFTHCPQCHEPWTVDPDAPTQIKRRIVTKAAVFCVLCILVPALGFAPRYVSFLSSMPYWAYWILYLAPVAGIVFGVLSAFWGYLALRTKRPVLGTTAMLVGVVFGVTFQSMIVWWGLGAWDDSRCIQSMTALSDSFRTHTAKTGRYPLNLESLKLDKLAAPNACPAEGGAYLYFVQWDFVPLVGANVPPATSRPTTNTASSTASATTLPESPETRAPATSSAPSAIAPESPAASMPAPSATATSSAPSTTSAPSARPVDFQALSVSYFLSGLGLDLTPKPPSFERGDSKTLMVVEKEQGHRRFRVCMTTDLVVHELPPNQFDAMVNLPQNKTVNDKIYAKVPDLLVEKPDMRILGLSPRQFLYASIAAIVVIFVIGGGIATRAAIKAAKE